MDGGYSLLWSATANCSVRYLGNWDFGSYLEMRRWTVWDLSQVHGGEGRDWTMPDAVSDKLFDVPGTQMYRSSFR